MSTQRKNRTRLRSGGKNSKGKRKVKKRSGKESRKESKKGKKESKKGKKESRKGKKESRKESRKESNILMLSSEEPKPPSLEVLKKIHEAFIIGNTPPAKNDLVTDEEMEKYFRGIDDTHKNMFTLEGHALVCITLKQMYNNGTIGDKIDALSYLKKLTDDQKESIQNGIKEIFTETINESSRVEVLSSQKGGGSLNIVALFSFLCVLMQTVNYSFYMQFITHEIRQLDNDMKGLSGSMDYGLVKYADSSVKQIYDEQFSYPPDKTILYYVLNNIIYPQFIEPEVRKTEKFQEDTKLFVMFAIMINDGFMTHIRDPTVEFTDMFSTIAISKQKKKLEKQFREHVTEKIDMFKILNKVNHDFIVDNDYYTKTDHKEIMGKVVDFEKKLEDLLAKVSTPTQSNKLLKDDDDFKKLMESLDKIGDFMEEKKTKLNEALNNLSESKEISFPSFSSFDDDNTVGKNDNTKTQLGKKFKDAIGFTRVKGYEKYITTQLTALYNGYLHPYIEVFKQIGFTIKRVINTLSVTSTTIKDIVIKLKDMNDNGDLKDILNTLPSKLSLFIQIYHRITTIIPGLLWYFGMIFTFLVSLFGTAYPKIISFIKKIRSRTRKMLQRQLQQGPKISFPVGSDRRFTRNNRSSSNSPIPSSNPPIPSSNPPIPSSNPPGSPSNHPESPYRRKRSFEDHRQPSREELIAATLSRLSVLNSIQKLKNRNR